MKIPKLLFGFLSLILFSCSLFYMRWLPYPFSWIIFWLIVILWILFITYQIIYKNIERIYILALLSIIMFVSLIRALLRPFGITLWGIDPYVDYAIAVSIRNNGWQPLISVYITTTTFHTDYPTIHFLGLVSSILLDVNLFTIVKWLPILVSISSILFIYLLTANIHGSKKEGLISCFLFSLFYNFLEMHSNFIKETIGFVFFLGAIYSYLLARSTHKRKYIMLSLLFAIMTVMSHHLTSLLLLIFLCVLIATNKLTSTWKKVEMYELTFVLFILVCALGYWTYLKYSPLEWIFRSSEYPRISALSTHFLTESTRRLILKIKEFTLGPIIGLIAIYSIKSGRKINIKVSLLFFGVMMGVLSLVYTQLTPFMGRGTVWGGRFMLFGYFSLIILASHTISVSLHTKKRKKMLCIIFVIIYSILQIYSIPPSLYSYTESPYDVDGGRFYILPSEQVAIMWLDPFGKIAVFDWMYQRISTALWFAQGKSNIQVIENENSNEIYKIINRYNSIFISKIKPYNVSSSVYRSYSMNEKIIRIYSNNQIGIYKIYN